MTTIDIMTVALIACSIMYIVMVIICSMVDDDL